MNLRIAQWREQFDCERIFDGDEYIASVGHSDMPATTQLEWAVRIVDALNAMAAHEADKPEGWPSWRAKAEEMERNWIGATETHQQIRKLYDEKCAISPAPDIGGTHE